MYSLFRCHASSPSLLCEEQSSRGSIAALLVLNIALLFVMGGVQNVCQSYQVDSISNIFEDLNEAETPLPRLWIPRDNFNLNPHLYRLTHLLLTHLRVHYERYLLENHVLGQESSHQSLASLYNCSYWDSIILLTHLPPWVPGNNFLILTLLESFLWH